MYLLKYHVNEINNLFIQLTNTPGRLYKNNLVDEFRRDLVSLNSDLDFCFEVLAGKHKLGYTLYKSNKQLSQDYSIITIKEFYNKYLKLNHTDNESIALAMTSIPVELYEFFYKLTNREFKLGYSNKHNMVTDLSPMLAKRYPDTFKPYVNYYIQEKLDGNRCIAFYDDYKDCWKFQSRSGKPMNLNFDMSWADTTYIFDGEAMTLSHAGTRDFNKTNGTINSKYNSKDNLHYFIYDIIDTNLTYEQRLSILNSFTDTKDCSILPVLDKVSLYPNFEYNIQLDKWLDRITDKGGEGLILRLADGNYEHKRSNNLIKYKKVQTMDLRIIDWNEGSGKYTGMIGSFVCQTDDREIVVNVAGMTDEIRQSNPELWLDTIIEVAYFDISRDSKTGQKSLRFPRLKKVRDDKDTTSVY